MKEMTECFLSLNYCLFVEIKCQLDATDDFYCRSYCLFKMFRAPLCPSSGAREYYTGGCCLRYFVFWFSLSVWCGTEGYVSGLRTVAPHHTDNLKIKTPKTAGSNHLYNTLELLMVGIMLPETCWANNKMTIKIHLLHLVGILFPHIIDDARSKPHQKWEFNLISFLYGTSICLRAMASPNFFLNLLSSYFYPVLHIIYVFHAQHLRYIWHYSYLAPRSFGINLPSSGSTYQV
jgi:hypothetical protein